MTHGLQETFSLPYVPGTKGYEQVQQRVEAILLQSKVPLPRGNDIKRLVTSVLDTVAVLSKAVLPTDIVYKGYRYDDYSSTIDFIDSLMIPWRIDVLGDEQLLVDLLVRKEIDTNELSVLDPLEWQLAVKSLGVAFGQEVSPTPPQRESLSLQSVVPYTVGPNGLVMSVTHDSHFIPISIDIVRLGFNVDVVFEDQLFKILKQLIR